MPIMRPNRAMLHYVVKILHLTRNLPTLWRDPSKISGMGLNSAILGKNISQAMEMIYQFAQNALIGSIAPGIITTGRLLETQKKERMTLATSNR